MSIPTPINAEKVNELSVIQRGIIRDGLIINDYPFLPNKSYIIFDAVAGSNNLHLATGIATSYTIHRGEGRDSESFSDTGGTKVLTYENDGRYIITIDGDFHGIELTSNIGTVTQTERDKYIAVILGTNAPVAIAAHSFYKASKLESCSHRTVTSIGANAFTDCALLEKFTYNTAPTIATDSFINTDKLRYLKLKASVSANATFVTIYTFATLTQGIYSFMVTVPAADSTYMSHGTIFVNTVSGVTTAKLSIAFELYAHIQLSGNSIQVKHDQGTPLSVQLVLIKIG